MLQLILVAAIVVVAFAVSVWKLMPARQRLRLLVALDARAAHHAWLAGWRERSLKPRIAKTAGGGCADCAANTSRPQRPQ
jgi:hypothetical protein